MSKRWVLPLDPDCPEVAHLMETNPPLGRHPGCFEFLESFERRHRAECDRCRAFGVENSQVTPQVRSTPFPSRPGDAAA